MEAVDAYMAHMSAYPGRTFGQLYHAFFRVNELAAGKVELRKGTVIDLSDVTVPVLSVAGSSDVLAPEAAVRHVGALLADVRLETAPGGHLGVLTGRSAHSPRGSTWTSSWPTHDPVAPGAPRRPRPAGPSPRRVPRAGSAARPACPRDARRDRSPSSSTIARSRLATVFSCTPSRAAARRGRPSSSSSTSSVSASRRVAGVVAGQRARACAGRTRAPGPGPWSAAPAAPRRRSGSGPRRRPAGGSRGGPPSPRGGCERKPASPSRGVPSATWAAPSAACGLTASGGAHPAIRSGPIGTSSAREPPTPAAAVSGTDPSAPPHTTNAAWRWRSSYRSRRLAESGSVGRAVEQLLHGGAAHRVGAAHPPLALQRVALGDERAEGVAGLEHRLRDPLQRVGQARGGHPRPNLRDRPPPERDLGHAVGPCQVGHRHVAARELAREGGGLGRRLEVGERLAGGRSAR